MSTAISRILFIGVSIYTLVSKWSTVTVEHWRLTMYLTYWTLFLTMAYQLLSFYLMEQRVHLVEPLPGERPRLLVRVAWILYSVVAPAGLTVSVSYWLLTDDRDREPPTLTNAMLHGGVAATVFLDGLLVGAVPMRAKHLACYVAYICTFLVFTYVQEYFGIGSGSDSWPDEYPDGLKEDSLYFISSWSEDFQGAATTAMYHLLFTPVAFFICWGMSLGVRGKTVEGGN